METEAIQQDAGRRINKRRYFGVIAILFMALLLRFGVWLLISSDPLPPHAAAAVVLQGSIAGENARVAGAVRLLQTGIADRIVLSIPHESFWGQSPERAARQYIEKTYGNEIATRLEFCETGPEVNSTEDEAKAVSPCLRRQGWSTIVVVTSDYHTRRAGMIWRHVMKKEYPSARLWIHGIDDPEFDARNWWEQRIYAKTAFLESTKLIWTFLTVWR